MNKISYTIMLRWCALYMLKEIKQWIEYIDYFLLLGKIQFDKC